MQVNKINFINFKENTLSREMNSQDAILMLRDPNASVKFEQNRDLAYNADSVSVNPIRSLGYKLYRTFNIIKSNDQGTQPSEKQLNVIA